MACERRERRHYAPRSERGHVSLALPLRDFIAV